MINITEGLQNQMLQLPKQIQQINEHEGKYKTKAGNMKPTKSYRKCLFFFVKHYGANHMFAFKEESAMKICHKIIIL